MAHCDGGLVSRDDRSCFKHCISGAREATSRPDVQVFSLRGWSTNNFPSKWSASSCSGRKCLPPETEAVPRLGRNRALWKASTIVHLTG
jgi:hypothetical protein